jgi:DNA-binding GntR family transcriptional regulator
MLVDCREYAKRGEDLAADGDVAGFLWLDRLFHRRLLDPLPNRYLADVIMRFRDLTPLIGLPSLAKSGELVVSAREHAAILDAIEQRDPERTEALMRRHLAHVRGIWSGRPEAVEKPTPSPEETGPGQVQPA